MNQSDRTGGKAVVMCNICARMAPGTVERGASKIQWTVCNNDEPRISCQIGRRTVAQIVGFGGVRTVWSLEGWGVRGVDVGTCWWRELVECIVWNLAMAD